MMTSNGAANAGIGDDQEQQHHHNQHISVGRQDSQTSPLTATPHCSPEQILDGVQYAQHQTMVDASSSDQEMQQQHLQPVPQRPLFDDAPSLLAQQHAAMIVQQQSSALSSTMQQQQQLNDQPMAMLNTPILFTNNTTTGTATGETSPMTTIKKQGRFRVVKGVTNDISVKMTLPLSSENSNSTIVGDDRNAIVNNSSNDAAGNSGNPEISPQSQPVSTIKKGRFLVKKASANNDANANLAATAAAHSGESDVELSPETVISFTTGVAVVDANVGIESSSLTPDVSNMNNKPAGAAKQKGRFLVKTGVESVAVVAAVGGGGTEVSSTDVLPAKAPEAVDTKATENLPASSVDVKKKGRFVVKTGGGTGITVSTDGTAAATNNVLSPMTPASGIVHQSNVANVQVACNNQQDSNLPSAAEVISVANTGVDASVQTMTTMASTLTAIPATMTTQNAMQQQNHQHTDSQTSILQVPSATSSIGSSSSVGYNYQQHQLQHQNLPQAPINDNDAYLQLPPVTHRRVLTDAITGSPTKANGTVVCGTSLGATGGGWMGGKSNGRMIGGGGVGKVLHYIDTMRTEVVEADRSIAALQSDNRHLRDKNKELEARNKDLERRLGEEKRLRQKVEDKYTSLLQQDIGAHQEMIPITVPPPPDRGNDRRYSAPPLPPFDGVNSNTSAINEEFPIDNQKRHDRICSNTEEFPSDVVIENQKQQPNRTHTGLMVEPIIIPLSRSNSPVISIMKSSHKPTYLSSNTVPDSSTIGSAKLKANIFDPLGVESTSTTAESRDHGGATQNNTVASTSASDASPQLNNNTVDRTKKHFDPLGTPESRATINSNDGLPPPLLLDGGLSQTSPTKCVDDPFDEIVRRVPHNHLQDYD